MSWVDIKLHDDIVNKLRSDVDSAEARAAQLEAERDELRAKLNDAMKIARSFIAERDALQQELSDLRQHHAKIIMSLYEIDHDTFGALTSIEGIAELNKQNKELRAKLEQAQRKIDALTTQLGTPKP